MNEGLNGISIADLVNALTVPGMQLQNPIAPIETKVELTPATGAILLGTAGILALGLIFAFHQPKK